MAARKAHRRHRQQRVGQRVAEIEEQAGVTVEAG